MATPPIAYTDGDEQLGADESETIQGLQVSDDRASKNCRPSGAGQLSN